MTKHVLLFGGSGRTGTYIAQQLCERGDSVTAMVRDGSDSTALQGFGTTIITGTPVDAADVTRAFAGGSFDAVISTLGHRRGEPEPRADVAGIDNIITAALHSDIRRMLMVTMIGAGDSIDAVSDKVKEFLGAAIKAKTGAEKALAESGLDYTILRPGGLTGDPRTNTGVSTTDHSIMGVISAGELARLTLAALDDPQSIGQIVHTIDPTIEQQSPLQRGEDLPKTKEGNS